MALAAETRAGGATCSRDARLHPRGHATGDVEVNLWKHKEIADDGQRSLKAKHGAVRWRERGSQRSTGQTAKARVANGLPRFAADVGTGATLRHPQSRSVSPHSLDVIQRKVSTGARILPQHQILLQLTWDAITVRKIVKDKASGCVSR